MTNQTILNWVNQNKDKKSEPEMKDELLKKGWKLEDINDALDVAFGRKTKAQQAQPAQPKKKIGLGCLVLLGVAIIIIIAIASCGEEEKKEEAKPTPEVTRPVLEVTREEVKKEFSFENYVKLDKVKEYEIAKEKDLSIKALEKRLSEYITEELEALPENIRKEYRIVVPTDIIEEELKSTIAQAIKDKSTQDLDIDEIVVFAYDKKEDIEGAYTMGKAEWCPDGEWAGVTPEIARDNIRDSYKIIYNIKDLSARGEIKYGLTEEKRKEIFKELVVLQDAISFDNPQYNKKIESTYTEIVNRYNIQEKVVYGIAGEGAMEGWPMP